MGSDRGKKPVKRPHTALAGAKSMAPAPAVSAEERERMVAVAAYFRAEKRGFDPGGELEDWLAAEAEVDASLRLRQARGPGPRAAAG